MIFWKCLIILYLIAAKSSQDCNYEKDHKWHVIGIYSACYNNSKRTELNRLAQDLDVTLKYLWNRTDVVLNNFELPVVYHSIDVCDDFNQLPKLVESINLDKIFYYNTWSQQSNKT